MAKIELNLIGTVSIDRVDYDATVTYYPSVGWEVSLVSPHTANETMGHYYGAAYKLSDAVEDAFRELVQAEDGFTV